MTPIRIAGLVLLGLVNSAPLGAQPPRSLNILTVPADRLPPGCRLDVPAPAIVSDRRSVELIHHRLDGAPPPGPDAPPLDPQAARRFSAQWSEDVLEAYETRYRAADRTIVSVLAVRFQSDALAAQIPPGRVGFTPAGDAGRVVIGPLVVRIVPHAKSDCFAAIDQYIRALR